MQLLSIYKEYLEINGDFMQIFVQSQNALNNASQQMKKEKSLGEKALNNAVAVTGSTIFSLMATSPISKVATNYSQKYSRNLSSEQIEKVTNASQKILSELTNLESKGVAIKNITMKPINFSGMPDWLFKMTDSVYSIAKGTNAGFGLKTQSVYVNLDKFSLATFHELGHAQNLNNSKLWSKLLKFKKHTIALSLIIASLPLFLKKEVAEEGKELTTNQKVKNAIRDFSPIAAVGTMLPVVAEETMASIRGCKWAKQLLSPDLANKVLKSNILGGSTYVLSALSIGLLAYGIKTIKDKLDK